MSEESAERKSQSKLDPKTIESYSKIVLAFVAVLGFLWGVFKYLDAREQEVLRNESQEKQHAETRRIEATRPYLERQLKLYTEATQVAARIATTDKDNANGDVDDAVLDDPLGPSTPKDAKARFWQLYWGELALVEDKRVESAMKNYGDALLHNASPDILRGLSLSLAHACRDSLAESWAVEEWKRPTYNAD